MMISDEPPVSQCKIHTERNESEEQIDVADNQNF